MYIIITLKSYLKITSTIELLLETILFIYNCIYSSVDKSRTLLKYIQLATAVASVAKLGASNFSFLATGSYFVFGTFQVKHNISY